MVSHQVTTESIADLLKNWLCSHTEITFCMLVGSFYNGNHDRYSDVDLCLLSDSPSEDYQKELEETLRTKVEITLLYQEDTGGFYTIRNGQKVARKIYRPGLILKGPDLTQDPPTDSHFQIKRQLGKLQDITIRLDSLQRLHGPDSQLNGVFDSADFDGEWFLVLRSFYKLIDTLKALQELGVASRTIANEEITGLRNTFGRRIPMKRTDHQIVRDTFQIAMDLAREILRQEKQN